MAEDQRRGRRGGVDTSVRTSAVWDSVHDRGHPPLRRARPAPAGARPRRRHRWPRRPARRARPPRHRRRPQPRRARRARPPGRRRRRRRPRRRASRATPRPCSRCTPAADASTWSAATARSRSSTTPPRRCAPSRRCSPTAATSACSSPSASPSCSPGPCPGSSPRPAHALTSDDGRWGAGRPAAAPVRRGRRRRAGQRGRAHRAGLPRRAASSATWCPRRFIDSEADRLLLLELEQAASRHPDYAFLGQLGAALHVLARRA